MKRLTARRRFVKRTKGAQIQRPRWMGPDGQRAEGAGTGRHFQRPGGGARQKVADHRGGGVMC